MRDADEAQRFVDAYMQATGEDEETARAIVDILLDPDPARFTQALREWADGRTTGTQKKYERFNRGRGRRPQGSGL